MKIPRYWTRAEASCTRGSRTFDVTSFGWSFSSMTEALAKAKDRAVHAAELASLRKPGAERQHYYHDGRMPMREAIVSETFGDDGQAIAIVTRNAYGALVLNTSRVMFVDVDRKEKPVLKGLLSRLFGRKSDGAETQDELARLGEVASVRPGWSQRVYATPNGYRVLVTHALFDPAGEEAARAFEDMGADPLYTRLCLHQECFRARLTPKPWRIGMHAPTVRYPWTDEHAEEAFRAWLAAYESRCQGHAACELVEVMGSDAVHPEAQRVIDLHDVTACSPGARLA